MGYFRWMLWFWTNQRLDLTNKNTDATNKIGNWINRRGKMVLHWERNIRSSLMETCVLGRYWMINLAIMVYQSLPHDVTIHENWERWLWNSSKWRLETPCILVGMSNPHTDTYIYIYMYWLYTHTIGLYTVYEWVNIGERRHGYQPLQSTGMHMEVGLFIIASLGNQEQVGVKCLQKSGFHPQVELLSSIKPEKYDNMTKQWWF